MKLKIICENHHNSFGSMCTHTNQLHTLYKFRWMAFWNCRTNLFTVIKHQHSKWATQREATKKKEKKKSKLLFLDLARAKPRQTTKLHISCRCDVIRIMKTRANTHTVDLFSSRDFHERNGDVMTTTTTTTATDYLRCNKFLSHALQFRKT